MDDQNIKYLCRSCRKVKSNWKTRMCADCQNDPTARELVPGQTIDDSTKIDQGRKIVFSQHPHVEDKPKE